MTETPTRYIRWFSQLGIDDVPLVGGKVASGKSRVITNAVQLRHFQPGEVLMADTNTPDWGTVMNTSAAIVIYRGGRTCRAAIVTPR